MENKLKDGHATEPWEPHAIEVTDLFGGSPLRRLAALLDGDEALIADKVPPLGHWLYFLPEDRQSDLREDGHPRRRALLPPLAAARRMWAGGRVEFLSDIAVGVLAKRRSIVASMTEKQGKSGALIFVTVRHEIIAGDTLAIVEEQDLVFRDHVTAATVSPAPDLRVATATRRLTADSRALFRYSAMTNNAHRIHYDRDYAIQVEGYPGLVVHGPYQATLLVDHVRRARPGADIASFAYRAVRPLFADESFELNLAEGVDGISLWTRDAQGFTCMDAKVVLR